MLPKDSSDAVCLCRPEMKFEGIASLIARIRTDAGIASKQLDTAEYQQLMTSTFLSDWQ